MESRTGRPFTKDLPGGVDITYLRVLEPDGENDTADTRYTIKLSAVIEHGNATFSYYYATEKNSTDLNIIAENISASEVHGMYEWDTSNVGEGDYYVVVVLDDGDISVREWSSGTLAIRHPGESEDSFISLTGIFEGLVLAGLVGLWRKNHQSDLNADTE